MRVFLDTNVLFDFLLDSRGVHHEPACEVMRLIAAGELDGGFSASQATDVYYSLRKATDDGTARDALRKLYSLCDLYGTSPSSCVAALENGMDDYEDAVQAETARENGCALVLTRNTGDYACSPVEAVTPREFIDRLR